MPANKLQTLKLNELETRIIQLVAKELSSREIAVKTGYSLRTIEDYRLELLKKIGARNGVGLVMYGIKQGIIRVKVKVKKEAG